ncbi:MAG TPA: phosphoglucosamine mutase, partial [candidate division Zixibacteria bacterium]|nr:phosphoglucosamine mutase [candidate division Zixibacteria bacterium]
AGGICITASHNPSPWNALKFFNRTGEFITPAQFRELDELFRSGRFGYRPYDRLGSIDRQEGWIDWHIQKTLAVPFVNRAAVRRRKFRVVVDAINGAGSTALPALLRKLGAGVVEVNCKGDGDFVHEPEPIPKNLRQLSLMVRKHKADIGMACDPDADRLALVDERGRPIGEELTLALSVQQVLTRKKGPVVINLSTSKVTERVARDRGAAVYYAKVGEANVVELMRAKRALVGGEGNGGVILPSFHAGRDALMAAALVLSRLAEANVEFSSLADSLPTYYTRKDKGTVPADFSARLARFEREAPGLLGEFAIDRQDGLRVDFSGGWVQIRTSNTEPIFRLIVETESKDRTEHLADRVMGYFREPR